VISWLCRSLTIAKAESANNFFLYLIGSVRAYFFYKNMKILRDSFCDCFSKISLVNDIYKTNFLSFGEPLKSLDDLIETCNLFLDKKITINLHNQRFSDHPIRGFYLSLEDSYEIGILNGQNFCWQRFVTCKEIFHVLLDENNTQSIDIEQLIDEVTIKFPEVDHGASPSAATELLTEICAAEFLFPYASRKKHITSNKKIDFLTIAAEIKIPRLMVEKFLSPSAMEILNPEDYKIK
jgi:hypothetical protein